MSNKTATGYRFGPARIPCFVPEDFSMEKTWKQLSRRTWLKMMSLELGIVSHRPAEARPAGESMFELSAKPRKPVNRRLRIVVQYDPQDLLE
jgi:hypothetical protein